VSLLLRESVIFAKLSRDDEYKNENPRNVKKSLQLLKHRY